MATREETMPPSILRAAAGTTCDTETTLLLLKSRPTHRKETWKTELKVLGRHSPALVVANVLQFSLNMSSILVISPRGKIDLGAVSIATTTANITGFMVFGGLATSLDTLCGQAWGAEKPQLKRLHVQKMTVLLGAVGVPIAVFWFFADLLLACILPDKEISMLAGLYLKILICALPGNAAFEAGKRILTAEGVFFPITLILLLGFCTNAILGWLLVWVSFAVNHLSPDPPC